MSMANSTFVSNKAGKDGLAIMSIGRLGEVTNVSFANNIVHCPIGQYGLDEEAVQVGVTTTMHCRHRC